MKNGNEYWGHTVPVGLSGKLFFAMYNNSNTSVICTRLLPCERTVVWIKEGNERAIRGSYIKAANELEQLLCTTSSAS